MRPGRAPLDELFVDGLRFLLLSSVLSTAFASSIGSRKSGVCGAQGYNRDTNAYQFTENSTLRSCIDSCQASPRCLSFAFDSSACLLYSKSVHGNFRPDLRSPYAFFDKGCNPPPLPSTSISRLPSILKPLVSPSSTPTQQKGKCGNIGYDKGKPEAFHSSTRAADLSFNGCAALCQKHACLSFALGPKSCLLYSVSTSANFEASPGSPFVFYDASCARLLPGTTSVVRSDILASDSTSITKLFPTSKSHLPFSSASAKPMSITNEQSQDQSSSYTTSSIGLTSNAIPTPTFGSTLSTTAISSSSPSSSCPAMGKINGTVYGQPFGTGFNFTYELDIVRGNEIVPAGLNDCAQACRAVTCGTFALEEGRCMFWPDTTKLIVQPADGWYRSQPYWDISCFSPTSSSIVSSIATPSAFSTPSSTHNPYSSEPPSCGVNGFWNGVGDTDSFWLEVSPIPTNWHDMHVQYPDVGPDLFVSDCASLCLARGCAAIGIDNNFDGKNLGCHLYYQPVGAFIWPSSRIWETFYDISCAKSGPLIYPQPTTTSSSTSPTPTPSTSCGVVGELNPFLADDALHFTASHGTIIDLCSLACRVWSCGSFSIYDYASGTLDCYLIAGSTAESVVAPYHGMTRHFYDRDCFPPSSSSAAIPSPSILAEKRCGVSSKVNTNWNFLGTIESTGPLFTIEHCVALCKAFGCSAAGFDFSDGHSCYFFSNSVSAIADPEGFTNQLTLYDIDCFEDDDDLSNFTVSATYTVPARTAASSSTSSALLPTSSVW